ADGRGRARGSRVRALASEPSAGRARGDKNGRAGGPRPERACRAGRPGALALDQDLPSRLGALCHGWPPAGTGFAGGPFAAPAGPAARTLAHCEFLWTVRAYDLGAP